ncbi:GNAT family N-acetyltransferase [Merismopedia glauca]|uniref:GNAT family N-acetyltransferase n=1 Tax=Merismopedia glauca CCAP 1448/3 TaxID=1296344 RepID=A0A2T1BYG5_9CYAN|nr:GNAT family N-acetyltransferase [Merismopedia glauca]PSB01075.1 GNAT family N-acetyltransferase [Merismopedia glauca CCAP 1448/3]
MLNAELIIQPCSVEHLKMLIGDTEGFTSKYGLQIIPGYLEFPGALKWALESLETGKVTPEWGTYMFIHNGDQALIGIGGYYGLPTEGGIVEIGYGIAPSYRCRGYATQSAQWLIKQAFSNDEIKAVWAHTLPNFNASTRVLEKCGMKKIAEVLDEEHGMVWQWEIVKEEGRGKREEGITIHHQE